MNPNHTSHLMHKVGIKVITLIIPGSLHENEWISAYKSIYLLYGSNARLRVIEECQNITVQWYYGNKCPLLQIKVS